MGVRRCMARAAPLVLGSMLLFGPQACGGDPTGPEGDELRILFIGNSLTEWNDLPSMLERLLELGGVENPFVDAVVRGGYGLPDHWEFTEARERIREGGWSVVVLQQGPSATEGRPYLLEYAELFAEEIRSAGAVPALYMVWPSRSRFFDFDGVLDSYRTAAEMVDGYFFPAGEAWRIAWEANADFPFYGFDGLHPTPYGSYMAALVMYEQLAGRDPRDLPDFIPTPEGDIPMSAELANTLQGAAREANARHARSVAAPSR